MVEPTMVCDFECIEASCVQMYGGVLYLLSLKVVARSYH